MDEALSVVIVGAGPAGLAAARHLVAAGIRPTVLEETSRPGGQGTRRLAPPAVPQRDRIFGKAASGMTVREKAEDAILAKCNFRADTLAWGCYASRLEVLGPNGYDSLPYTHLLLAVGATDRLMPVPGWTLPGVFTLGGAQVALKRHASFVGAQVVFAGSSPLLYLAAAQYLRLGHRELTVLDTTPFNRKIRSLPAMLRHAPKTALQGIALIAELHRAKVRMEFGVSLKEIEGAHRVEAVRYRARDGQILQIGADAVAFGHGLRAETQLAELAGATFDYDARHRQWFPRIDAWGHAAEKLWIAGDGARTAGAAAAEAAGHLAAEGILAALGRPVGDALTIRHMQRRLKSQRRFQDAMTRAFQWPAAWVTDMPDDTVLCRCERILIGEVRGAIAAPLAPTEINRVKALTRCGMGRCQGRFCGPALAEVVAGATGDQPGRLRAQSPIRPIPLVPSSEQSR